MVPNKFLTTQRGEIWLGDSLEVLSKLGDGSVDLVMTSPPFGLVRKKEYGNVDANEYVKWFKSFAEQFIRVIKPTGSLVIDIGGAWNAGTPTKHLYLFKLLIMLVEEFGFHLAQDFYWWNPSRLPTPAEWVTVRRIRVKDAINCIWWLSPTPWPKASNRRILQPYSESMKTLLAKGYKAKKRPSGHDISKKFNVDNGASIPPNLIVSPNTESNSYYLRYCNYKGIKAHPARYPSLIPEYFIRMLTDENDVVVDPFAGSCVTGEVAERLSRRWICVELSSEYLEGAKARFSQKRFANMPANRKHEEQEAHYKVPKPDAIWHLLTSESLPEDGGRERKPAQNDEPKATSSSGRFTR